MGCCLETNLRVDIFIARHGETRPLILIRWEKGDTGLSYTLSPSLQTTINPSVNPFLLSLTEQNTKKMPFLSLPLRVLNSTNPGTSSRSFDCSAFSHSWTVTFITLFFYFA